MTSHHKLLALPLFQGLSRDDLWSIAESIPFAFLQHHTAQTIVSENQSCDSLIFLLDGTMQVTTHADDHGYTLSEAIKAPQVIEPERLFGLSQHFMRTYTALTSCNTLSIHKKHVIELTEQHIIFRLNLLNIITTQSQRLQQQPWHPQPKDLRQRIIRFFIDRSLRPAGEKVFKIKMIRLATELNAGRPEVSATLNAMQSEGLINLRRGQITIAALEKLI